MITETGTVIVGPGPANITVTDFTIDGSGARASLEWAMQQLQAALDSLGVFDKGGRKDENNGNIDTN